MNDYTDNHFFDTLRKRVKLMLEFTTPNEVVIRLVESEQATAEQVWLCVKALQIMQKTPRCLGGEEEETCSHGQENKPNKA